MFAQPFFPTDLEMFSNLRSPGLPRYLLGIPLKQLDKENNPTGSAGQMPVNMQT